MPSYELGFAEYAAAHPEVGAPLTDEWGISPHYNVQETTNGLLVYQIASDAVQFADFTAHDGSPGTPPEPTTGQVEAIDVSNYQEWAQDASELKAYIQGLTPPPTRVIVRLASYLEPANLRAIAIDQLRAASALYPSTIKSLGAYGWMYRQAVPSAEVAYWNQQVGDAQPAPLYDMWLDVEDDANCPTLSQINTCLELLTDLHYRPGVYTGKPFWEEHFGTAGGPVYDYPLWIANYSPAYTLDTVPIPSGWVKAQGWQYTSAPCDRNVFRS